MINNDSFGTPAMTESQQIQFDRLLAAEFSVTIAHQLIKLGAWLGTLDMTEQKSPMPGAIGRSAMPGPNLRLIRSGDTPERVSRRLPVMLAVVGREHLT